MGGAILLIANLISTTKFQKTLQYASIIFNGNSIVECIENEDEDHN